MLHKERKDTMASITARKNKQGEIVSYQIEVFRGRDASGKKLKPYSMNWKVPKDWKEKTVQKELNKVAAQFENDCKAGYVASDKKTFAEYSDYVMTLKERDNKHKTVFRYRQLLKRITPEIGHVAVTKLSSADLNQLYLKMGESGQNKRTGKGLSPQSIIHHHRLIHAILAQAVKEGIIHFNPADGATPPKQPKHEADFFEIDDVIRIRKALHEESLKWQAIVFLLIDTGARRGEIMGLKWSSIDFSNNQINIENNLLYTPDKGLYCDTPKTGKKRIINIAPEIVNLLKIYRKEQLRWKLSMGDQWNDTNFCFTQDNGLPMYPDSLNTYLYHIQDKYNLPPIHPHKFRHTHASILYELGENPITISKRLGHDQVSTTQNMYSHVLKDSDKKASDNIANLLYRNKTDKKRTCGAKTD
ncbi:site-specific integrase [Lacrimispora brassicae]